MYDDYFVKRRWRLAATPAAVAHAAPDLAPLLSTAGPAVLGSYIVVLKGKSGPSSARAVARAADMGVTVRRRYTSALNGFSAELTPDQISALRRDPDVAFISPNQRVTFDTVQTPVTWGLDRVDQRNGPLDNIYDYNQTGAGVTVYIIDTGIRATHVEFGGRVSGGFDAIGDGHGTDDCYGHGTHVAGTAGAGKYGVAKGVQLVPVRVGDCAGWTASDIIISGVDWVTANRSGPSVANMSLSTLADPAIDLAVGNSIGSGVTYVVSASNGNSDACERSPARVPAAITVAATNISDSRASFSNFGRCVDLFAPGENIVSAGNFSDTHEYPDSGTSMASAHVAGAVALYMQNYPWASPDHVTTWITINATPGVVSDVRGSPNLLLYSHGPAWHTGMTWTVKEQRPDNVVYVGSDSVTNAYHGDAPATDTLPVLCLLFTDAPLPSGITPDGNNGWARGSVQMSPPVPGTALTSFTEGSRICSNAFGPGWVMAEFHDGYWRTRPFPRPIWFRSGWNFWAHGTLPVGARLWVSINDQPANPWN